LTTVAYHYRCIKTTKLRYRQGEYKTGAVPHVFWKIFAEYRRSAAPVMA
jgi:hypothetical protein